MTGHPLEKWTDYREFCSAQTQWEEFTGRLFPENYSKTFPWLAAWWESYLDQGEATVYLQRDSQGRIAAAAPFFSRWEHFGGLPVRLLHLVGHGIGTDDLLVGPDADRFLPALVGSLCEESWHVARFHRVRNAGQLAQLLEAVRAVGCRYTLQESLDYLVELPGDYQQYLGSRSRKFRRNLNQAENRLNRLGNVEFLVLDPYRDAERVIDAGLRIARGSWQYRQGLSHFNERQRGTLYESLSARGRGAGGEDFNLLLVDGNPVAYLLGCRRQRTYYAVDTAFHEDFRSVSAGRILFNKIVERLILQGEVDLLDFEGAGEYKDDYANATLTIQSVLVYRPSAYGRLVRCFKESALFPRLKALGQGFAKGSRPRPTPKEQPEP
ncbi:hypothetical protein GMLC_01340 [Geomonas limicola]|uniref:BioF2-like acetyltransferase domain-containing protein n=1 Tax=Geomonas limicola TaxID=2740186 RepID=A0A6V8N234_9BACT|nr:GNAT family N-acetyltransferase [Geomonas limicola]GFO66555.1 hypothetical protein GMLC_01340 [Geomonas limicola]